METNVKQKKGFFQGLRDRLSFSQPEQTYTPPPLPTADEGSFEAMFYDFKITVKRFTDPLKRWFAKTLFLILIGAFLWWTSSLVIALVEQVLPNQESSKYFAVALFSGGTIVWLLMFLNSTDGIFQTIIAFFMVGFDLLGEGLAVVAEVYLGGQKLIDAPEAISVLAIWVLIIWTFVNITAAILYKLLSMEALIGIMSKLGQHWTIFLGTAKLVKNMVRSSGPLSDQLATHYQSGAMKKLLDGQMGGRNTGLPPNEVLPVGIGQSQSLPPTALEAEPTLPPTNEAKVEPAIEARSMPPTTLVTEPVLPPTNHSSNNNGSNGSAGKA